MCCKAIAFDYICYFTGTAINVFRYLDSFLKIPEITVSSFGQDLLEKSENLARDLAKKKDANKKSNKVAPQSVSEEGVSGNLNSGTEAGIEDGASGQGKGGRRRKGNQSSATTRPSTDFETVITKEGKGKRRGGKSKGEKQYGETVTSVSKGSKSGVVGIGAHTTHDEDDIFTLEFLASKILEWFPDLESAGVGNDLFSILFSLTLVWLWYLHLRRISH
jgi:hypothetical protein